MVILVLEQHDGFDPIWCRSRCRNIHDVLDAIYIHSISSKLYTHTAVSFLDYHDTSNKYE